MTKRLTLVWVAFTWCVIVAAASGVLYFSYRGDLRVRGIASKVSRIKSDLRAIASALEAYYVAHNAYPPSTLDPAESMRPVKMSDMIVPSFMANGAWYQGATLTTPVEYLTSTGLTWDHVDTFVGQRMPYCYCSTPNGWLLFSAGPDRDYDLDGTQYDESKAMPGPELLRLSYDPTNGLLSGGDIFRVRQ